MISVLPRMLRTRPAQAVAVALLSALAVAAAVAAPLTVAALDAVVVHGDVARSTPADRAVSMTADLDATSPEAGNQLVSIANQLALPGFTQVAGGQFLTFPLRRAGVTPSSTQNTPLVYRADLCAHVVMTSGRCLAGTYEVLLSADVARAGGLRAGQTVIAQAMTYNRIAQQIPDGPPTPVTIAGLYRPRDPGEVYWGPHGFFPITASGQRTGPVFTNAPTFDLIGHADAVATVDVIAPAGDFSASRRAVTGAEVTALLRRAAAAGPGAPILTSNIPDLVARIDTDMAGARGLVGVAFVALVALGWAVIHLTVGYTVGGRRGELALAGLRGLGRLRRWWLATGETLAAIVAGVPVGYLAGSGLVDLITRTRLDTTAPAANAPALLAAAAAAIGALVVAVLAVSGLLRTRVADLLRGVPGRRAAWRPIAVELAVIALAAVGVAQLRGSGLLGVGVAVPGLVVAATALLGARAFTPLAAVAARASLRRGRLGTGLAAVQIARRPGGQRLFALVAVAVGLAGFTAATTSVATAQRTQQAAVAAGAPTVVHVSGTTGPRLLAVTHRIDPAGSWAMAVLPVAQESSAFPPVLAVDATRLPAVSLAHSGWSARAAATALTGATVRPVVLRGRTFTVDAQVTGPANGARMTVAFAFVSLADGTLVDPTITMPVGPRSRHTIGATQCANGCRLTGFTVAGSTDDSLTLTLFGLHTATTTVLDAGALAAAGRWDSTSASPGGGGLQVVSGYDPLSTGPTAVTLRDTTAPVPALSTQTDVTKVTGPDGQDVDTTAVGSRADVLPRLGRYGTLVDLATLDDVGLAAPTGQNGEVWLGPHAPATAVAQLRAAGLAVASIATEPDTRRALAGTGAALALQFHLAAAGLGLLLALGALAVVVLVDRPARAADLRALRRQGMPPRVVTRVAVGGYLSVVLAAAVAGLAATAVAWVSTGTKLPVYGPSGSVVPADPWPHPGDVLAPWAVVTAVLAAAAIGAGWILRRAVATNPDAGVRPGRVVAAPIPNTSGPRTWTRPLPEGENAMAGLAVTCRRVVQIYRAEAGDVVALAGVDLTIAPGETLALVGPSGSGKSTLIALLAGLMRPSAGRITLGTYDLGRLSDGEITRLRGTEIGVVLQGAARNLLPYATIAKNIQIAQARAAQTRGIRLDDPSVILDLVGLRGFDDSLIVDLPPGAQQRAALAVGIATGPGLLLVDEPTSQLDLHGRDEVIAALETVSRERGTTIVVVTHDSEVGNRLGRAVTIRDGRVGAEGRGGQDFAVVAGDGTVQLPPEVLGDFPPGTLFTVERSGSSVSFALNAETPDPPH